MDLETRSQIRQALQQAVAGHLYDPNVRLIDFGYPYHEGKMHMDERHIRVHVRKKLFGAALQNATAEGMTRMVPPTLAGYETDVIEVGEVVPELNPWGAAPANPHQARRNPLVGGISISNERQFAAGTLGGLVYDNRTGEAMLMSNFHVLVGDWGYRVGQRIYQPGRLDGGTAQDTVAFLVRDAMGSNLDAAVARVSGARELVNDQLAARPVTGVKLAELGLNVMKSGRTTGVTYGMVTGIEGIQVLTYDGLRRQIRSVVTIEPRVRFSPLSRPGDSGSWWLDEETGEAVCLHFAGSISIDPAFSMGMEMTAVLAALDVSVAVQVDVPVPEKAIEHSSTGEPQPVYA